MQACRVGLGQRNVKIFECGGRECGHASHVVVGVSDGRVIGDVAGAERAAVVAGQMRQREGFGGDPAASWKPRTVTSVWSGPRPRPQ